MRNRSGHRKHQGCVGVIDLRCPAELKNKKSKLLMPAGSAVSLTRLPVSMTLRNLGSLFAIVWLVLFASLSGCSGGSGSNNNVSLSPVGHRWVVENESGLLCYDSADDLETARGMGDDFEDITPAGFHFTGDESAGGRLIKGDIISIDSAGADNYIVTPIRASVVNEGKSCAVDIAKLELSKNNSDSTPIATWTVGATYTAANDIEPCFLGYGLAAAQYDAEVNSEGTGNGEKSLHVTDAADDEARYRLERIDKKVLTFYVIKGDADVNIKGYRMRSPHTGDTIYCAHENKPAAG